jgi:A/G-specific adenine glycosylase
MEMFTEYLSRLFNIDTPINSTQGKKDFQLLADELLNKKQPALHNSAIMEFGALWCRPQNPKCEECPLQAQCLAFQNKTVALLPVKDKKIKIKNRYLHYFIFNYKNYVYIQKRTEKDIWQNLYEFYLLKQTSQSQQMLLLKDKALKRLVSNFKVKSSYTSQKTYIISSAFICNIL